MKNIPVSLNEATSNWICKRSLVKQLFDDEGINSRKLFSETITIDEAD